MNVNVAASPDVRDGATPASERQFFGHPRGLAFIAGTEFWERISFHGLQALLVLYMVDRLLRPGHVEHILGFARFRAGLESVTGPLSVQALATQIFGLYVGLAYFMPVIGGALGDRVIGRRRAVALGAFAMTAGHFCMAFDQSFLLALVLLVAGAGLLRGNLASQLGDLYSRNDHRRERGFQTYYFMLNFGAFVAPLVTGVLAVHLGWEYGFGFAGLGMLAGLLIYRAGRRYLPADVPRSTRTAAPRLKPPERRVVAILLAMLPLLSLFWVAQSQIWNTYNLWARDHVDLVIGTFTMPVPWLQAIDALGVLVLVPVVLRWWRWQAARGAEPDLLAKLGWGCVLFGVAVAWLAAAQLVASTGQRVPLIWAIGYHFLAGIGYIYFAPTAVTLYSRSAPATVNALMVGIYYVAIFAGSAISGRLGGLYERVSGGEFWGLHALVAVAGGVLVFAFAPQLRRELGMQVGEG
jgi:POT family proton-dependent oligopeptide transporter